ncbi:MAG: hypothetical protein NTU78_19525, partial [Alphaproteobacteria bacterium]|nr:hypothetical protein [Alphaproteobacteria bacterium]
MSYEQDAGDELSGQPSRRRCICFAKTGSLGSFASAVTRTEDRGRGPPRCRVAHYPGPGLDCHISGCSVLYHLQYGESLALFLKAPTQLYLFVVIAWHGLTLDPLRVAFAGIMAAAGWLLLMLAAIYQGGEEIITRDFMTYMMSSRVLIGAEVDRIIAILLFTAVLCVG